MQNYLDAGGGLSASGKQLEINQKARYLRLFLDRFGLVLGVFPAPFVIMADLTACRLSYNPFKSCKSALALPWSLICATFFTNRINRIWSLIRKNTKAFANDYSSPVELVNAVV